MQIAFKQAFVCPQLVQALNYSRQSDKTVHTNSGKIQITSKRKYRGKKYYIYHIDIGLVQKIKWQSYHAPHRQNKCYRWVGLFTPHNQALGVHCGLDFRFEFFLINIDLSLVAHSQQILETATNFVSDFSLHLFKKFGSFGKAFVLLLWKKNPLFFFFLFLKKIFFCFSPTLRVFFNRSAKLAISSIFCLCSSSFPFRESKSPCSLSTVSINTRKPSMDFWILVTLLLRQRKMSHFTIFAGI